MWLAWRWTSKKCTKMCWSSLQINQRQFWYQTSTQSQSSALKKPLVNQFVATVYYVTDIVCRMWKSGLRCMRMIANNANAISLSIWCDLRTLKRDMWCNSSHQLWSAPLFRWAMPNINKLITSRRLIRIELILCPTQYYYDARLMSVIVFMIIEENSRENKRSEPI